MPRIDLNRPMTLVTSGCSSCCSPVGGVGHILEYRRHDAETHQHARRQLSPWPCRLCRGLCGQPVPRLTKTHFRGYRPSTLTSLRTHGCLPIVVKKRNGAFFRKIDHTLRAISPDGLRRNAPWESIPASGQSSSRTPQVHDGSRWRTPHRDLRPGGEGRSKAPPLRSLEPDT
jgi:hypothetical protein